ncbi:hypothetical protein DPEC_G00187990 [Dallia pectoralis]|uniref:Uncharacterized protein n=1 Tax=Dallia pectoralis TaxID=75939 RepID=A0ACC2GBV2_DALPE|nr:hypothetical protein DPEC_G00187990 [Dallia pectoralis]
MDCTPDLSHQEQLSVVLRVVNGESSKGVSISEHFVGFLNVLDTTGKGLCESFLGHLETLGLDIANCRGPSYDNGSNMQGKKQGVQKRVLDMNNNALSVPCGSHTLNLVVGDAAKSSLTSISFFGLLQRLYTLFSSSVNRWAILTEHVTNSKSTVNNQINKLSKVLQSPQVSIETLRRETRGVTEFLEKYREKGLTSAQTDAREIAEKLKVEMTWPEVRQRRAARQFEYEGKEQTE